jgi:peptidoglycan/LPS O-acetylase OafA/YrhL
MWRERAVQAAVAWLCLFVATLTFMGVDGYGFQMRHIAPAAGAVYVIAIVLLLERERPRLLMASAFAMLVGTVTGAMYLLVPEFDEIMSLARIAGIGSF